MNYRAYSKEAIMIGREFESWLNSFGILGSKDDFSKSFSIILFLRKGLLAENPFFFRDCSKCKLRLERELKL